MNCACISRFHLHLHLLLLSCLSPLSVHPGGSASLTPRILSRSRACPLDGQPQLPPSYFPLSSLLWKGRTAKSVAVPDCWDFGRAGVLSSFICTALPCLLRHAFLALPLPLPLPLPCTALHVLVFKMGTMQTSTISVSTTCITTLRFFPVFLSRALLPRLESHRGKNADWLGLDDVTSEEPWEYPYCSLFPQCAVLYRSLLDGDWRRCFAAMSYGK